MKKRCIWTNQRSDRLKEVIIKTTDRFGRNLKEKKVWVLPEFEQELREFSNHATQYSRLFIWLIIGMACIIVVMPVFSLTGIVTKSSVSMVSGISVSLIGYIIFRLPYTTPETVSMVGLKTSINIAKCLGVFIILLGLGILLLTQL